MAAVHTFVSCTCIAQQHSTLAAARSAAREVHGGDNTGNHGSKRSITLHLAGLVTAGQHIAQLRTLLQVEIAVFVIVRSNTVIVSPKHAALYAYEASGRCRVVHRRLFVSRETYATAYFGVYRSSIQNVLVRNTRSGETLLQ